MKHLLRDFTIGPPAIHNCQSVDAEGRISGNVLVFWPLIGPSVSGVGFWGDFELEKDLAYNRLKFKSTRADGPCVIPQGTMLVGQGAQARTVPGAEVFYCSTTVKANCVEPRQAGLFNLKRNRPAFTMMPVGLRVQAHRLRHRGRTETLWPAIRQYNLDSRVAADNVPAFINAMHSRANLMELPRLMPGQRGIAVTLNSVLLGVEVAPTDEHFRRWWAGGLAESYAVEAARKARPLRLGAGRIEDILLGIDLGIGRTIDGKIVDVERRDLHGQAVYFGGRLAYASLLSEEM
jgi:hypothetical protein